MYANFSLSPSSPGERSTGVRDPEEMPSEEVERDKSVVIFSLSRAGVAWRLRRLISWSSAV